MKRTKAERRARGASAASESPDDSKENVAPSDAARKALESQVLVARLDEARRLPALVLLALAHEAMRGEAEDDRADVVEAAVWWPHHGDGDRRKLQLAAREALGKKRTRRAELVQRLLDLSAGFASDYEFSVYAATTLIHAAPVLEAEGIAPIAAADVARVAIAISEELAGSKSDHDLRVRSALRAVGAPGKWVETATDKR